MIAVGSWWSSRQYEVLTKVLALAWGVVLIVEWGAGLDASALLSTNIKMGLLWCYFRERAITAKLRSELATARSNKSEHSCASIIKNVNDDQKTASKGRLLSWNMLVGAAGIATTTVLVIAKLSVSGNSSGVPKTRVVIAASHLDSGVPLSLTNFAYVNAPDSVLAGYDYIRLKDAYVLLGHKLLAPIEYAHLIQWTNTDIVIEKLPIMP